MFERRLKLLLIILLLPATLLVLRLVQLQVLRAETYRDDARRMLLQPVRFYPCLRGSITDHQGRRLAYDAESWDLCVHYGILDKDRDYIRALAFSRLENRSASRSRGNIDREVERLRDQIELSWQAVTELTGVSRSELDKVRERTIRRVKQIRENVSNDRGIETVVLEERMLHPVVKGLDQSAQVEARMRLADYAWIDVVANRTRKYAGGEAVGHFLGLLHEVDARQVADEADLDKLTRYRAGDTFGFCGVEKLAEDKGQVRGRRGHDQEDAEGSAVTSPVNGKDFRLTIDLPLQQTLYGQLASAVRRYPFSTGGAAVVLDVPSRHVLAMVSYPSFDPGVTWQGRLLLAQDQLGQPTSCRAIAAGCLGRCPQPGSTVKPMVLAAALTDRKLAPNEEIVCRGHLFPDVPNEWKCTRKWGHDSIGAVYSIQHSCNVFYYELGQRIGVQRLAHWMSQFGLGRPTGIGLAEERPGNLPIDGGTGNARHMGIGQWQVEVTPLQAANMVATIASGQFRPVTIWADDPDPRPAKRIDIPEQYWGIVREGMYEVVNKPGGTAYETGRLTDAGDYVLLGKTGSAEPPPQVSLYTCRFPDGREEVIEARNQRELFARYQANDRPVVLAQEPAAKYPTHGWFVGYLAPKDRYLQPANHDHLSIAIAVLIEYAGHGGEVAAPVARDMLGELLDRHEGHAATGPLTEASR